MRNRLQWFNKVPGAFPSCHDDDDDGGDDDCRLVLEGVEKSMQRSPSAEFR